MTFDDISPPGAWARELAARPQKPGDRPCPFCGAVAIVSVGDSRTQRVYCHGCYASGPTALTIHEAWQAWNRRA